MDILFLEKMSWLIKPNDQNILVNLTESKDFGRYSYMSATQNILSGNGARGHYNLKWALTSFIIWVLVLLAIHLCKMGPIAYLYVANEIPCAAIPGPECKRLGLGF
jgi:hypothetical protein